MQRGGGEWIIRCLKELVRVPVSSHFLVILNLEFKLSNDPTLSSLPLLSTFLKTHSRPHLGLTPPSTKQIPTTAEPETLSLTATINAQEYTTGAAFPSLLVNKEEELVE